jgi:membrane-associated phospholipid phosphatase
LLGPANGRSDEDAEPRFFDGADCRPDAEEAPVISLKEDIKQLPWMLWNDNLALYTWRNAVILGVAAGGAVAVRDNLDQRVRADTAAHPLRWGEGSVVLRQFGEYTVQVPALAAVYTVSLWVDDDGYLHEFSKSAISAYAISAMYTVLIKGITNTSRPTNQFEHGHYGFPSYHASSTFSLAAVVDEYYGWQWGVPAYIMAGLVGWSRIDQREHDLSDVLFGAVLGVVVGKTVAAVHMERYSNLRVTPYFDPATRTSGISVDTKF